MSDEKVFEWNGKALRTVGDVMDAAIPIAEFGDAEEAVPPAPVSVRP